jgi:hypothetical protein
MPLVGKYDHRNSWPSDVMTALSAATDAEAHNISLLQLG